MDTTNLKAVHHKPCPICSEAAGKPIRCNGIKGGYSLDRARRIIEGRTGMKIGQNPGDAPSDGRPWLWSTTPPASIKNPSFTGSSVFSGPSRNDISLVAPIVR